LFLPKVAFGHNQIPNPKPAMRQASPPEAGESQIYPLQSGLARLRRVPNFYAK